MLACGGFVNCMFGLLVVRLLMHVWRVVVLV